MWRQLFLCHKKVIINSNTLQDLLKNKMKPNPEKRNQFNFITAVCFVMGDVAGSK